MCNPHKEQSEKKFCGGKQKYGGGWEMIERMKSSPIPKHADTLQTFTMRKLTVETVRTWTDVVCVVVQVPSVSLY